MDFSIVICTYNRAEALERTLEGFTALAVPVNSAWELILVDNCSTDRTRQLCATYEGRIPLRYLREERQGKTYALNSGIADARAPLVLLTDDDVDVTPGWASAIVAAANKCPDADFFGGKVLPRWQGNPPAWFAKNAGMIRSNPRIDIGDAPRRFSRGDEPLLIGANLALRKSLFTAGFNFRHDLGPSGDGLDSIRAKPEEFEWQQRLLDAGHAGIYIPEAIVHHRDPPWRMTEKYIRHWYTESGRNRVKEGAVPRGREWLGAPRYLWREVLINSLTYLCTRWLGPSRTWLSAECRMCLAWGSIKECRSSGRLDHRETRDL